MRKNQLVYIKGDNKIGRITNILNNYKQIRVVIQNVTQGLFGPEYSDSNEAFWTHTNNIDWRRNVGKNSIRIA